MYKKMIRCLFALFLMGLIALGGCDILEPPYKKDNIQITSDRKVLLEDYTGHQCVNCPAAAGIIDSMLHAFPDNLVVISVHAGKFAKPFPPTFSYDFRTETGDAWCDFFGFDDLGYPNGLVNRKERSGSLIIPPNNWAVVVAEMLNEPVEAEITLTGSYDPSIRQIQVKAETNISSPKVDERYYLTVVLTEDSIIRPQKNIGPTPTIMDYTHMHVLRESLTGTWGVQIDPDIIDQKNLTLTLDTGSDIIPERCHIVAFISRQNKEILQAETICLMK